MPFTSCLSFSLGRAQTRSVHNGQVCCASEPSHIQCEARRVDEVDLVLFSFSSSPFTCECCPVSSVQRGRPGGTQRHSSRNTSLSHLLSRVQGQTPKQPNLGLSGLPTGSGLQSHNPKHIHRHTHTHRQAYAHT